MKIKVDEYPQLRFCRVRKGTKKPFEEKWTEKPYTWNEISNFLSEENYGVLCGYGDLAVIDSDKKELQDVVEKSLPSTFRVKTGSGGTHNYFFIPELKEKIILETKLVGDLKVHFGEVQSYGTQVVGVGSIHPNGNSYIPINENDIVKISLEQLYAALKPFMVEIKETEEYHEIEKKNYGSKIDEMSVLNIWGTSGLKKQGDEYYGSHPVHGSDGGMNFWINPNKNLWHCFRCNSGGGALSAIAVKEGLISCSEAQKGVIRGEKAIEALKYAKEKYGLKDDYKLEALPPTIQPPKIDYTLIWDKELKNFQEIEKDWLIDKLIPSCSVGVWTGKRATYKTFTALEAIYSIASGLPFLNRFPTKQGKVLYLDKENGVQIMKQRVQMIKNGKGMSDDYDVAFICFSTLKLDKLTDINEIEKLIKEHNPSIIFIDTYRRAISFDENDAGEVSKLFVDTLRPLVEKYHITIVLIHHDKKSNGQEGGDEMDQLRGSSDLANYADFILKNKRKGQEGKIILEQIKNRNAPEINPLAIAFETDNETYFKFNCEGDYVPQTKDEKCAEALILWIGKNQLDTFKTSEAKDEAFSLGFKKSYFHYALKLMEERGVIKSTSKGVYQVLQAGVLYV